MSGASIKSIQTDRVILTLGPAEEVDFVRSIYHTFVHQGRSESEIAADLNGRCISTDLGRPWTRGTVHQLLINEKYVGDNVWNRRSFKLKKKRVRNEPGMWIKAQDAFEAIVERELFEAARTIINARSFRLSDSEMLQSLKELYQQKGLLSGIVIDECDGLPSSSAYSSPFRQPASGLPPRGVHAGSRLSLCRNQSRAAQAPSWRSPRGDRRIARRGQRRPAGSPDRPSECQRRVQPFGSGGSMLRDPDRAFALEAAF